MSLCEFFTPWFFLPVFLKHQSKETTQKRRVSPANKTKKPLWELVCKLLKTQTLLQILNVPQYYAISIVSW